MEEQEVVSGENKALRSLNADVETHVNFINQSKQRARAWWLDYSGHPVSYGDIRTNGLLRMDTFLSESLPHVFLVLLKYLICITFNMSCNSAMG